MALHAGWMAQGRYLIKKSICSVNVKPFMALLACAEHFCCPPANKRNVFYGHILCSLDIILTCIFEVDDPKMFLLNKYLCICSSLQV